MSTKLDTHPAVTWCMKLPSSYFVISQFKINFHYGLLSFWGDLQYWKTGWYKWNRTPGSCSLSHSQCALIFSLLPPGSSVSERENILPIKRERFLDIWCKSIHHVNRFAHWANLSAEVLSFVLGLHSALKKSALTWVKFSRMLCILLTFTGNWPCDIYLEEEIIQMQNNTKYIIENLLKPEFLRCCVLFISVMWLWHSWANLSRSVENSHLLRKLKSG